MLIKKAIGAALSGGVLPHYTLGYTWKVPKTIKQFGASLYFEHCGKNIAIGRRAKLSSKIYIEDRSGMGGICRLQGETKKPIYIKDDVWLAFDQSFYLV